MLPAGIDRYRLDVGGYAMHVMEMGRGRPVLLLHGNPTWSFLYRKVAACLAGQPLRLIMPDLVGLGFSDKPRSLSEHRLDNHAEWVSALVRQLELDDLLFVGQDWGGPIGLCALARGAAGVSGLVLMNTVAGPPKPGFRPTLFHRLSQMPLVSRLLFEGAGLAQNAMPLVQGNKRSLLGSAGRAYRYPLRHLRERAAPLGLARMVPNSTTHDSIAPLHDCERFVADFRGPAELVWGDRDPILGRVRTRLERLLPHAKVTRTRAGHFLQEEVPDEIAAAIERVAAQAEATESHTQHN